MASFWREKKGNTDFVHWVSPERMVISRIEYMHKNKVVINESYSISVSWFWNDSLYKQMHVKSIVGREEH